MIIIRKIINISTIQTVKYRRSVNVSIKGLMFSLSGQMLTTPKEGLSFSMLGSKKYAK